MKSRGACSGRHLEGYRTYPAPFGCVITIPEVRRISVWIIPQAMLGQVLCRSTTKAPGKKTQGRDSSAAIFIDIIPCGRIA
jgi:hypothetical protein